MEDGPEKGDWGVIAPTFGDARDVCFEGPSGLKHALAGYTDGSWRKAWNRSQGQLRLANGATVFADGADDGALRVQGKNLRGAWLDEVGLWRKWEQAFDESVTFAVRLDPAVMIATGTPKAGHGLVKRLLNGDPEHGIAPADHQSHMRMADNIENLSPVMVQKLIDRYGDTTLGRQELDGELLEEVEGALWSQRLVDLHRLLTVFDLDRIVVGVDPQGALSGETGIVVAGVVDDCPGEKCAGVRMPHYVVVEDASVSASPAAWASAVALAFHTNEADRVVAEKNFGGDMVQSTLETADGQIPVTMVTASRGKRQRAEPIAALYEQGRVHHRGSFGDLESEMVSWRPEDNWSPNRLDALVWAITELIERDYEVGESWIPGT
jgi:phage terminase large subunit-like protein